MATDRQAVDFALVNARIATFQKFGHFTEALAAVDGRIVALGRSDEILELCNPETRVLDAAGRTALPGLIDSHCHPDMHGARIGRWTDLSWPGTKSRDDLLEKIASGLEGKPPGTWFAGFRFDDVKLGGYPSREELDRAGGGHPVYIFRTDGHIGLANSAALELCGIGEDRPDPPFGHFDRDPASGRLTGLLREAAAYIVVDQIQKDDTPEILMAGLERVFDEFHRYGVTSLHNSLTTRHGLAAYQGMREAGALRMRMGLIASGREDGLVESLIDAGIRSGFGDEWLRMIAVEWCPDCSTSGRTAAYYEPYEGEPVIGEPADNRGMLLYEAEDFKQRVIAAHKAGFMVCADGVGDRGIDFVLDAYEAALEAEPRRDHRMRVEHCCYVTPDIRARLKRLGVIASSATGFAYDLGDAYRNNRGQAAMKYMWPHRSMIDDGVMAPGHSDSPICDPNPLRGVYSMVARKTDSGGDLDSSEAVSIWEALEAYTVLGAYAGREEQIKGSLSTGKLADICLLDRDIFTLPAEEIPQVEVEATVLGGDVVFQRQEG